MFLEVWVLTIFEFGVTSSCARGLPSIHLYITSNGRDIFICGIPVFGGRLTDKWGSCVSFRFHKAGKSCRQPVVIWQRRFRAYLTRHFLFFFAVKLPNIVRVNFLEVNTLVPRCKHWNYHKILWNFEYLVLVAEKRFYPTNPGSIGTGPNVQCCSRREAQTTKKALNHPDFYAFRRCAHAADKHVILSHLWYRQQV